MSRLLIIYTLEEEELDGNVEINLENGFSLAIATSKRGELTKSLLIAYKPMGSI